MSRCRVSEANDDEKDWRVRVPPALADEANLKKLSDPRRLLPHYGTVVDMESDTVMAFRSDICPIVQDSIINYVANPPRMESGHTKFLAVVGPRQCTKSTTAALALAGKVMYSPGTQGVTIADEQDRADTLFESVMFNYQNLPTSIRMPQVNTLAKLRLNMVHGGRYKALTSGFSGNVGLGRGIAWTHISEGPFHKDFGTFWNKYYPAVNNRKNAAVILESTPGAMSEPSAAVYRDTMAEARQGIGRWEYVFAAFWNSILNERPWRKEWTMSIEELRLMEIYGRKDGGNNSAPRQPHFLSLENLAFLREVRVMDSKIKKDPDLLWVFYPKDDVSCWHIIGNSAFPTHAMESLLIRSGGVEALVPWRPTDGCYQEYQEPRSDGIYVIGVDPSGWGSGDPSSFQVGEVWSDEISQVAEFETNTLTPPQVAEKIIEAAERYNDAEVFCESNGVGAGVLAVLEMAHNRGRLKNLHYYAKGKPGVPNSVPRHADALGAMVDAALDVSQGGSATLVIRGVNLQSQLGTYRQDKAVQEGSKTLIMKDTSTRGGRREKHHWDRVSAFLWMVYGAREQNQRKKPNFGPVSPKLMTTRAEYLNTIPRSQRNSSALVRPRKKR